MRRMGISQPAALISLVLSVASMPAAAQPDLNGTWILFGGEGFAAPDRTPLNTELQANYDFAHDDPSLHCIPASWTRVYSNPNTPLEIIQHADQVEIRFELFDIRRTIPLIEPGEAPVFQPADPANPTLGENVGWYEGDELVVMSRGYGDEYRVLTTIRGWAGLHQSPLMVTEERYRRGDDELLLDITHFDPLMYRTPLTVNYGLDAEYEWTVAPYNCEPEDAAVNSLLP